MKKQTEVEKHFDEIAADYDKYKKNNSFYYDNLKKLLASFIPKNSKVLEIGCGTGDILESLKPKKGYGMDISSKMVSVARKKHKKNKRLYFSTKYPTEKYDYIFMTDVIEHLENPEEVFKKISTLMNNKTVFVNTMANPIWEPLLMVWEKLGWKMPEGKHYRISFNKIKKMLSVGDISVSKHDYELLIPVRIPFFTEVVNRYLGGMFRKLSFIEYFVATKSKTP